MAIADLSNVLKIFGGSDVSDEERVELRKEVMLMTLARAADADINIQSVEVDRIRAILKEKTGEDFSSADVRASTAPALPALMWPPHLAAPIFRRRRPRIGLSSRKTRTSSFE